MTVRGGPARIPPSFPRDVREAWRLLGLADRLRRERSRGIDVGAWFLRIMAAATALYGWIRYGGAPAPDRDEDFFVVLLLHLPLQAARLSPGPPEEWDALRMPSRGAGYVAGVLRALPWLGLLGLSWAAFVHFRILHTGPLPAPAHAGTLLFAFATPALWKILRGWHRVNGWRPGVEPLHLAVNWSVVTVVLIAGWGLAARHFAGDGAGALERIGLGLLALLPLGAAAVLRHNLRALRARPYPGRSLRPAWNHVLARLPVDLVALAWAALFAFGLLLSYGEDARRLALHAGPWLGVATAVGAVAALALVAAAARDVVGAEAVLPEPGEGTESAARSAETADAQAARNARLVRHFAGPVPHGGGLRAAGRILGRATWVGKRWWPLVLALRWRGPLLAATAVLLAGRLRADEGWPVILAISFAATLDGHATSARAYLLGADLREQRLHEVGAAVRTMAMPALLAGAAALPFADGESGPTCLLILAAGLLLRLGWTGWSRLWARAWLPSLAARGIPVLLAIAALTHDSFEHALFARPGLVAAALALHGAAGLGVLLHRFEEGALREEMRTDGAAGEEWAL